MDKDQASILLEEVLDILTEFWNTGPKQQVEMMQEAREKLFRFRDEWFKKGGS
jgi:hypothetical protein